jgi:hypothetical protein
MAHSFDTKVRWTNNSNPSTQAYTCGATATLLVVGIVIAGATRRTGGAPTYNGVALEPVGIIRVQTETNCEMWYLTAPPVGAEYTISVPNAGALTLFVCASSYISATGYSALDVETGGGGTSANPSLTLTPTVNGDVLVAVCGDGLSTAPTDRTATTLYETDDGSYSDNHQYVLVADTSATAVGWTVASDDWTMTLAAFKETSSPVVVVHPTIDTYISQTAATTNYGTAEVLATRPYTSNIGRILLKFDFSSIVPAGATISSATLRLYATTGATGRTITVYRELRTDWVEAQATWNIYKTDNNWGTAGALNSDSDYTATDAATAATVATLSWLEVNVTTLTTTAWVSVGGIAHFLVADVGASATASKIFASKDNVELAIAPQLVIQYAVVSSAIKTVNGLVKASVKTKGGLAIASVSKWNGLA